jgi:hypothetical protein
MKCFAYRCGAILAILLSAWQCALGAENGVASLHENSRYSWETTRIGNTAELVSLLCHGCGDYPDRENVPLLSVLRDTLGDDNPENNRLIYIWLLTYSPPSVGQRLLSGIPFFYWRIGGGGSQSRSTQISPLLDLTSLRHPMISSFGRDLLQWTVLDSAATPIRATSRAYRANEVDQERLHLEETIGYLNQAAGGDLRFGLTAKELNTLVARLELRKTFLGGFVREEEAAQVGEDAIRKAERIRSRNWELLRQCADKTGLYFEPLDLAGSSNQYALLWFALGQSSEPDGTGLSSVFKLLNIKNPWHDTRLKAPSVQRVWTRDVDENGNLLPMGLTGVQQVKLVPLGAYSLSYPKAPLLLVDFRDRRHVRWHEVTQRSINEITAGVIGISHFTNWYYYVAADAYNFVVARHGGATNRAERLDCYSQFRVALQLDSALDARLRKEMEEQIDSLSINPLESAPRGEIAAASLRYDELKDQAQTGSLEKRIDDNRREELALDAESRKGRLCDYVFHLMTFGAYTHRVKPDSGNNSLLDTYRRAQYQLAFLDRVSAGGTEPEVAYDPAIITRSISELESVIPGISSRDLREHAAVTLTRVKSLSQSSSLQADCSNALAVLERGPHPDMQAPPEPADFGVFAGGDGLE